jgi:hypothetical protein
MDERRRFFRIKNNGDILAKLSNATIEIVDISASGARIIDSPSLDPEGIIEISIHHFLISLHYEKLRSEDTHTIIIFNNEAETNKLFAALKYLRDERKIQQG